MKNRKKHFLKYSCLIIILIGTFVSIYVLIGSASYENREPKTFTLDNDLFYDDFSYNLDSGLQMENAIKLNLPWSTWNLRDFNIINNSSFVFTLNQSSEHGEKLNIVNQLNVYSNKSYDINELDYNVTCPLVMNDENTLLFSPQDSKDSNITYVFDMENKEITNILDGRVYKVLSDKNQYLLISNDMLIIEDINTNKKQELIYLEEIESLLYSDYIGKMEKEAQFLLDESYYSGKLITDFDFGEYERLWASTLREQYEAAGYEWPEDISSPEDISFFPFMYLNPWNFQISNKGSQIYFKVDFGPDYSIICSLDIYTTKIDTLLEGNIESFKSIDNDKLIIKGTINDSEGLYIYNIQNGLTEEIISSDVHLFDISSDGKLAYITINASGTNELRVAYYDGEDLKSDSIVYISSEYMEFLQWSPSGEELFYISDSMGTSELLLFKIKETVK